MEEARRLRGEHRREMGRQTLAMMKMLFEERGDTLGAFERDISFVPDIRMGARIRPRGTCARDQRRVPTGTHERTRLLAKATLPQIRFHDLRHSRATQMLSSGVHPKIASERLGHSTIGITLDPYSHVMPGMQANDAEQVDAAIKAAKQTSRE